MPAAVTALCALAAAEARPRACLCASLFMLVSPRRRGCAQTRASLVSGWLAAIIAENATSRFWHRNERKSENDPRCCVFGRYDATPAGKALRLLSSEEPPIAGTAPLFRAHCSAKETEMWRQWSTCVCICKDELESSGARPGYAVNQSHMEGYTPGFVIEMLH